MASKLVLSSISLWSRMTKLVSSNIQQTAGYFHHHSCASAVTSHRILSSFHSASFLRNICSDTKSEILKPACSLFMSGNQGKNTVLVSSIMPSVNQIRSYQCVVRMRLMCGGCYYVWRHGRKFVECSDHAKHKQMKRLPTRKIWQEDYSKGNIAKAHDWSARPKREFYSNADRTALSHNWLAGRLGKDI